jgi:hypothetical protein
MKISNVAAVPTLFALVLGVAACGQQQQAEYEAVCVNQATGEAYDEDDQCDPEDDDYEGHGSWYFVPMGYHKSHKSSFKPGHKVTGGSFAAPGGQKVRYQGSNKVTTQKKVDVYSPGKQAGTPIKNNQDARKSTTVRGGENGGSYSKPKSRSNSFKSSGKR